MGAGCRVMVDPALACPECDGGEVEHYRTLRTCAPLASPRRMRVPCPLCGGDGRRACEDCGERGAEHMTPLGALCGRCWGTAPVAA